MEHIQQYKNYETILNCLGIVCFFSSILFMAVLGNFNIILGISCFILLVILSIILFIKASIYKNKYTYLYKENLVYPLLNENFDNVLFNANGGFNESYINNIGLIKRGNSYHSEDYLEATYNGVNFKHADVKVIEESYTEEYNSDNQDYETRINHNTYFMGRILEIDCPYKDIKSVQIFTNSFKNRGNSKYDMTYIEVESVDFNNQFDVFTANDMEAFYILTPPLMEKLIELKEKYKNIGLCYQDNKLYIAIWTPTNTFDGMETKINSYDRYINYDEEQNKIIEELNVIKEFIDKLSTI